ncbi:MAG: winged helix-turn-helix domain-containing protein [Nitrososphaeraceae archaeon]
MKYRSRDEIIEFILESISKNQSLDKTTPTKIMYNAFLSYSQLKEYLSLLWKREIIQYNNGNKTYRLTEKGEQYRTLNKQMSELLL